jgi:hypothetical protein
MATENRFQAEWIETHHADSDGEWNPDLDTYAVSYHNTKEKAESAAITASKKAAQCEWIRVSEQQWTGREWQAVKRWSGDYEGLHDDPVYVADEAME